jgi:hypothetical protein
MDYGITFFLLNDNALEDIRGVRFITHLQPDRRNAETYNNLRLLFFWFSAMLFLMESGGKSALSVNVPADYSAFSFSFGLYRSSPVSIKRIKSFMSVSLHPADLNPKIILVVSCMFIFSISSSLSVFQIYLPHLIIQV